MEPVRSRVAVRASRSAPLAGAAQAASAAGVSVGRLLGALADLPARGRCAEQAAAAAMAGPASRGEQAAALRECPPPARSAFRHWVPVPQPPSTQPRPGHVAYVPAVAARNLIAHAAAAPQATEDAHRMRAAAAAHSACPGAVAWRLAGDSSVDVHWSLAWSLALSHRWSAGIMCVALLGHERGDALWKLLTARGSLPPQTLASMVASNDSLQRLAAAKQSGCRPRWLRTLVYDIREVHLAAVAHPQCPADILEEMARDRFSDTRAAVASNPSCPAHLIHMLSADDMFDARRAVASRSDCPHELFAVLARDGAGVVRSAVASNAQCPRAILTDLASKRDSFAQADAARTLKSQDAAAA